MHASPDITKLAPALAEAQAATKIALKDSTNKFFNNAKYASLAAIWDACREALHAHGLSVVQSVEPPAGPDDDLRLVTTILHTSGQWIATSVPLPIEKPSVQAVGSAMTYGRRYGLAAALGIVAEEDDDGAHAETHAPQRRPEKPARPKAEDDTPMTIEEAALTLWGKERVPLGDLRNSALERAHGWAVEKITAEGEKPTLVRLRDASAMVLAARKKGTLVEPPRTNKAKGTWSPPDPTPPQDETEFPDALKDTEDDGLPF